MKKATTTTLINDGIYYVPTANGLLAYVVCTDGYTGLRCFTTGNPIEVEGLAYENAMEYWDAIERGVLKKVEYTEREAKVVISDSLNGRKVYNVFLAD